MIVHHLSLSLHTNLLWNYHLSILLKIEVGWVEVMELLGLALLREWFCCYSLFLLFFL